MIFPKDSDYVNVIITNVSDTILKNAVWSKHGTRMVSDTQAYVNLRKKAEKRCIPRGGVFQRMLQLEINRIIKDKNDA